MKEAPHRSNGSGPRRLEQEKVPSQEPQLSEQETCEIRATRGAAYRPAPDIFATLAAVDRDPTSRNSSSRSAQLNRKVPGFESLRLRQEYALRSVTS
jgi:hypothetical protein